MSRRTRLSLWCVAAALVAWGVVVAATAPPEQRAPGWEIFTHILPAASFFACGLILLDRGRSAVIGVLMLAVGVAWEVPWLGFYHWSVGFTIANLTESLYQTPLGHLAVAYPSGRLRSTYDRVLVTLVWSYWVVNNFAFAAVWDPRADGPTRPWERNLLLIHQSPRAQQILDDIAFPASIVLTSAVVIALILHWKRSTAPGRRALAPMLFVLVPTGGYVILQETANNGHMSQWLERTIFGVGPVALASVPAAMLFGLWRSRASRGAVSDLVMALSEAPEPGRLREALARALGDPSVQLAYPREGGGGYVDADGHPVALPSGGSGRTVTVLQGAGQDLAALIYDEALAEEPERVAGVGAALRLALENERLQAQVRAQLEEVRASRSRILQAGDAERQRIERNLHDGAQQRLVSLTMALRMAEAQADGSNPALRETLQAVADEARHALVELRELSSGLHPAILTRGGLTPAVRALAERAPVPVDVVAVPPGRFPPDVEAAAYFVVSEAIANAGKHAGASRVAVEVGAADGCVRVSVTDDGVGGADPSDGSGLTGLADRVAVLGGTLTVESPRGEGTRIVAEVPCAS